MLRCVVYGVSQEGKSMLVARPQLVRFVILFPGRTGSTFLVSALDSHRDVEAKGEVLDGLRAKGVETQRAWGSLSARASSWALQGNWVQDQAPRCA